MNFDRIESQRQSMCLVIMCMYFVGNATAASSTSIATHLVGAADAVPVLPLRLSVVGACQLIEKIHRIRARLCMIACIVRAALRRLPGGMWHRYSL